MGYKTIKELLQNSKNDGAVGAFNIHNMEFIKGVVKAAEEENRPAIMMINEAVLMYGGIDVLGGAAIAAPPNTSIPPYIKTASLIIIIAGRFSSSAAFTTPLINSIL